MSLSVKACSLDLLWLFNHHRSTFPFCFRLYFSQIYLHNPGNQMVQSTAESLLQQLRSLETKRDQAIARYQKALKTLETLEKRKASSAAKHIVGRSRQKLSRDDRPCKPGCGVCECREAREDVQRLKDAKDRRNAEVSALEFKIDDAQADEARELQDGSQMSTKNGDVPRSVSISGSQQAGPSSRASSATATERSGAPSVGDPFKEDNTISTKSGTLPWSPI
jgi:hypothetical protein